jgi:Concanavalin A-like lectin/glucanases superfamily/Carbohydrate family 9 binding domain-like
MQKNIIYFCSIMLILMTATVYGTSLKKNILFCARYNESFKANTSKGSDEFQSVNAEIKQKAGIKSTCGADLTANKAYIAYPAKGNINVKEGTIQFWITNRKLWTFNGFYSLFRLCFDSKKRNIIEYKGKNSFFICKRPRSNEIAFINAGKIAKTSLDGIPIDQAIHIAVTWGQRQKCLYINGELKAKAIYISPNQEPLEIMISSPSWKNDAVCALDEMKIFNKSLTAKQIKESYNDKSLDVKKLTASENKFIKTYHPETIKKIKANNIYKNIVFKAHYIKKTIKFDGSLNDDIWAKIAPIKNFFTRSGKTPEVKSEIKILYDDKNIYFGAKFEEPFIDKLKASYCQRDLAIYGDDCLEMVFDTRNSSKTFYHFVANMVGGIYDTRNGKKRWSAKGSKCIGKKHNNFWTLEFSIPFADLGIPRPFIGEQWGLRLCRERKPVKNLYSIPHTQKPYFSRNDLGKLIFQGPLGSIETVKISCAQKKIMIGANQIKIALKNMSGKPLKLTIKAVLLGPQSAILKIIEKKLNIQKTNNISFDIKIKNDQAKQLVLTAFDKQGKLCWGTALTPAYSQAPFSFKQMENLIKKTHSDLAYMGNSPYFVFFEKSIKQIAKKMENIKHEITDALQKGDTVSLKSWNQYIANINGFKNWYNERKYIYWQVSPWENGSPEDVPNQLKPVKLVFQQAGNERECQAIAIRGMFVAGGIKTRLVVSDLRGTNNEYVSRDCIQVLSAPYIRDSFKRLVTDPLIESDGNIFSLTPGKTQKFWITFNSKGVAPGKYTGNITIKPLDITAIPKSQWKKIPVTVTVWNFTLPETHNWPISSFLFHGRSQINETATMRLLHSYHINYACTQRPKYGYGLKDTFMSKVLPKVPSKDFPKMGKRLKGYWPRDFYFNPKNISSNDDFLREAKRLKMKLVFCWNWYKNPEWYKLMIPHLQKLGLTFDDYMFQGMSDEFLANRIPLLKPWHEKVYKLFPKLRFFVTLTSVPPPSGSTFKQLDSIAKYIDTWIMSEKRLTPAKSQRWQKNYQWSKKINKSLWGYRCRTQMSNWPILEYYRFFAWTAYLSKMKGIALWTLNSAQSEDCMLDVEAKDKSKTPTGIVFRGINKRPIPTKRLEALREGLEDYAYITILKKRLQKTNSTISKSDILKYERLISNKVIADIMLKQNQQQVNQWRLDVANAILDLK